MNIGFSQAISRDYKESLCQSAMVGFDQLPEDIVEYLFMHLPPYGDLQNCRLVSSQWKHLVEGAVNRMRKSLLRCSAFDWFLLMQQQELLAKSYSSAVTERCSHSACFHKASGCVFVFGGCTAAYTTFNDLWRFDLSQRAWSRPMPSGCYPTPKACATLVEYKDTLLLFGGWSKSSPNPIHQTAMFYNELHIYDVRLNTWNQLNSDGQSPHLAGHSTSVTQDCMVVFGGSHGSGSSNRVYVYDIKAQRWYSPNTTSPKPAPRYGQSQILVDDRHLLIVGGCGGPNLIISEVWLLTMNWGGEWLWEELAVLNPHLSAPQLWSHPACKVGSKAVVLSKSQRRDSINISRRGQTAIRGTSYRSMSMSPRLSMGDADMRANQAINRSTSGWVPPQGNLIPPRQRKLISSRSLDEQDAAGSNSSSGRSSVGTPNLGVGAEIPSLASNVSTGSMASSSHNSELQRARSIPAIIVGEIPRLVVTEEVPLDQRHLPRSALPWLPAVYYRVLPPSPNVEVGAFVSSAPAGLLSKLRGAATSTPVRLSALSTKTVSSSFPSRNPSNHSVVERHAEALRRMNEYINNRMSHQADGPRSSGSFSSYDSFNRMDAQQGPSGRLKFRPSSPPPQARQQSTSSSLGSNSEDGDYITDGSGNNKPFSQKPTTNRTYCGYSSLTASKNPMSVYVLDFSYVLTAKSISWSVLDENWDAPEDTILYSLVQGCGELILFGGMRSQTTQDCHGLDVTPFSHTITNETYILRPPIKFQF